MCDLHRSDGAGLCKNGPQRYQYGDIWSQKAMTWCNMAFSAEDMAEIFYWVEQIWWITSVKEITADILGRKMMKAKMDIMGPSWMLRSGTGKWTSQSALDLGVPCRDYRSQYLLATSLHTRRAYMLARSFKTSYFQIWRVRVDRKRSSPLLLKNHFATHQRFRTIECNSKITGTCHLRTSHLAWWLYHPFSFSCKITDANRDAALQTFSWMNTSWMSLPAYQQAVRDIY